MSEAKNWRVTFTGAYRPGEDFVIEPQDKTASEMLEGVTMVFQKEFERSSRVVIEASGDA